METNSNPAVLSITCRYLRQERCVTCSVIAWSVSVTTLVCCNHPDLFQSSLWPVSVITLACLSNHFELCKSWNLSYSGTTLTHFCLHTELFQSSPELVFVIILICQSPSSTDGIHSSHWSVSSFTLVYHHSWLSSVVTLTCFNTDLFKWFR